MHLCKVLLRSGAFSTKTTNVLRSPLATKQFNSQNTSLIPRRLLMSSLETGGLRPYQSPRRVKANVKIVSMGLFALCSVELYLSFVKEDEINKFLGTDWNTAAAAITVLFPVMSMLGWLILAPTVPF